MDQEHVHHLQFHSLFLWMLAPLDSTGVKNSPSLLLNSAVSLFARYQAAARPTQDLDLAAHGLPNTPEAVRAALQSIVETPYPDGLSFDPELVGARVMQIESKYSGVAATVTAHLGRARQVLPLDISFGNVITPAPVTLAFPRLLVLNAVLMSAYPLETVVAEKFAALVELGLLTTRMKDIYDLHIIAAREAFDQEGLATAIARSFEARGTASARTVLAEAFALDEVMGQRWSAYLRRTALSAPADFSVVMQQLRTFLEPVTPDTKADRRGHWSPQERRWKT